MIPISYCCCYSESVCPGRTRLPLSFHTSHSRTGWLESFASAVEKYSVTDVCGRPIFQNSDEGEINAFAGIVGGLTSLRLNDSIRRAKKFALLVQALATSTTLTALDLSSNVEYKSEAVLAAFTALLSNTTITSLNLSSNSLVDIDLSRFSAKLALNKTLLELNMDYCGINHLAGLHLCDAMSTNKSLTSISVQYNAFSSYTIEAFYNMASEREFHIFNVATEYQLNTTKIANTLRQVASSILDLKPSLVDLLEEIGSSTRLTSLVLTNNVVRWRETILAFIPVCRFLMQCPILSTLEMPARMFKAAEEASSFFQTLSDHPSLSQLTITGYLDVVPAEVLLHMAKSTSLEKLTLQFGPNNVYADSLAYFLMNNQSVTCLIGPGLGPSLPGVESCLQVNTTLRILDFGDDNGRWIDHITNVLQHNTLLEFRARAQRYYSTQPLTDMPANRSNIIRNKSLIDCCVFQP